MEDSIEKTEQVLYEACAKQKPRQLVSVLASDIVAVIDNLRGTPAKKAKPGDDK